MTERSVFLAALDITDPAARSAYLDETCAADHTLRQRVEVLLAAHAGAASFMDRPAPDRDPPIPTVGFTDPNPGGPTGWEGETLLAGRYQLAGPIGEGGMWTVYRADQVQPVKRVVAVKLIKPGMDSKAVLARFEAERQALALMDHPHISKVLDAGVTPDGRPFFVMELVNGVPLTDYCDAHRLPVADRLHLFLQVCDAVQHAHQKGLIHRDLKPSNVLVESHDGKPVPKVIDFGLAKAVGGVSLTEQSQFTTPGLVAGTPLYMAPEQAGPNPRDVDTRADVYALGAVLYELLTGSTPIRRDALKHAALDEVLRVIREEEPPPSRRFGGSDTLPAVAASRRTEPPRLGRLVRGELDWIVMKALEKDRGRRYESAAALADDVERFLNHEPVAAGPPTAAYRMRKFIRRNRAAVTAGGLLFAALVAGMAGTTIGLVAEARQRDLMEGQRDRAVAAEALANGRLEEITREKGRTAEEADIAREVSKFLQEDILLQADSRNQADRREAPDPNLTLRQALDRAAARIGDQFKNRPATEAAIRRAIGEAYSGLGEFGPAIPQLELAVRLLTAKYGPTHEATLAATNGLGVALREGGRPDDAVRVFEKLLASQTEAHGESDPNTLLAMGNLAVALNRCGRTGPAVEQYEKTVAAAKTILGPNNADTLVFAGQLAQLLTESGQAAAAVPMIEDVVERQRKTLTANHPDLISSLSELGSAYLKTGNFHRAVVALEEADRLAQQVYDPHHPLARHILYSLGAALVADGQAKAAVPVLERLVAAQTAVHGRTHQKTLVAKANLGHAFTRAGDPERGATLLAEVVETATATLGRTDDLTIATLNNLAEAYRVGQKWTAAASSFEEAVRLAKAKWGAQDVSTLQIMHNLAVTYRGAGRPDDARRTFLEQLASARAALPAGGLPLAAELARAGSDLMTVAGHADAEPILRESFGLYQRHEPDGWRVFNARALLGAALLGQRRYEEAEQHLTAGYAGLAARSAVIPPRDQTRVAEAADRLIDLYTRWGKPDEVRTWRSERSKYPVEQAPPPREKK